MIRQAIAAVAVLITAIIVSLINSEPAPTVQAPATPVTITVTSTTLYAQCPAAVRASLGC